MPLGSFEREVLRAISANRSNESFVAGASILHHNAESPRSSLDIDLFHDSERGLAEATNRDLEQLTKSGYEIEIELKTNSLVRAAVSRSSLATRIDWVVDSPFRFFPPEPDPQFGWRINFWDGATNKVLAHFNRHEFRDFFDLVYLHKNHLRLAALVWAAAGKDPGLTPELILDWLKRNSRYSPGDVATLNISVPPDLRELKRSFLEACAEAESLFPRLPLEHLGCFYLDQEKQPVLPNPNSPEFARLIPHFPSLGGSLPPTPSS